jgi:hypothetical protein
MKSKIAGLTLGLLIFLLSPTSQGQAVTAQVRVTDEIIASNGKVIASHIRDGVYYRTSSGSTLTHYTTLDGNPTAGEMASGSLSENGTNYQLDYTQHRAYVAPFPPPPPHNETPRAQNTLGQSSVEGIACTLFPVVLVTGGTKTPVGTLCDSDQYHLILRMDITNPGKNGTSSHNVTELYNIKVGLEPDPKLFDLQHNFTIYRADTMSH